MLSGFDNSRKTLEESHAKSVIRMWNQIAKMNLTPSQKAVYKEIALYSELPGGAFPSLQTLASRTGYTIRGVQLAVHQLEDQGRIKASERWNEKGRRLSNYYEIVDPDLREGELSSEGRVNSVQGEGELSSYDKEELITGRGAPLGGHPSLVKPGYNSPRPAEHLFDSEEFALHEGEDFASIRHRLRNGSH